MPPDLTTPASMETTETMGVHALANPKRIAFCGFNLESNRFAPSCSRVDFEENMYFRGAEITRQARMEAPAIHLGVKGFYGVMDEAFGGLDGWIDAPALLVGSTPAGPVEEVFFKEFLEELRERMETLGPVDGVYLCQHGAAVATHTHDPDGDMFALVREIVGPGVPVIATLDLHANVSDVMMNATDMMIGYRTNPHVDMLERGEEAARAMLEMFDGVRPAKHRVRLPLVAPSVTQLTAEGYPYGDLIRLGQTRVDAGAATGVMNVTILSGFAFGDTPKNGMTIITHTRGDAALAERVTMDLAEAGWADRERYRPTMIPLENAIARAKRVGEDAGSDPLLFADPADNPGGGGRGNTTYILKALLDAGVQGCVLSVFFDRAAVAAASAAGVGATVDMTLNAEEENAFSEPLSVKARVVSLHDGEFVGKYGMVAGTTANTGPTAVLDLGGVTVVCISKRQQCRSSDYLSAFGIDPSACRSIVVKSRGHFRAGFQHLFPAERILEVDVPGLTSPNLANFDWRFLPRPVFPLDPDASWARS
jgi:microcystin degradation protein MlrC